MQESCKMENTPAETAPDASKPASIRLTRQQLATEYMVAFLRIWEALKASPKPVRELEKITGYSYHKVYNTLRRFEARNPPLVSRKMTKNPETNRNEYVFLANEKAL